jgi:hypothetical protein
MGIAVPLPRPKWDSRQPQTRRGATSTPRPDRPVDLAPLRCETGSSDPALSLARRDQRLEPHPSDRSERSARKSDSHLVRPRTSCDEVTTPDREGPLGPQRDVALPHEWPLAHKRQVTWESLSRLNCISVTSQSSVRVHADRAATAASVRIVPFLEVASLSTALGLVRAGPGLHAGAQPVPGERKLDGLACRPVHRPLVHRSIGLLTRNGVTLSPAATAFAETARTTTGLQLSRLVR